VSCRIVSEGAESWLVGSTLTAARGARLKSRAGTDGLRQQLDGARKVARGTGATGRDGWAAAGMQLQQTGDDEREEGRS